MNLLNLQKYAITKDFFEQFKTNKTVNKDTSNKFFSHKSIIKDSSYCNPTLIKREHETFDKLFWTFYSLLKSDYTVQMIQQHGFKLKNEFSMKFIEEIKRNKGFLRENKLRFHNIETSLLYDEDISLSTFKALVLFNKMNVVYIWNNKYYMFEGNEESHMFHIIRKMRNNGNCYTTEDELAKKSILEKEVLGKLYMEDTRTQLKSVSSYKLNDLKIMAETLGIGVDKKKTKQVLYEEINSKID